MTQWHKGANSFVRETLSKILIILRAKIKAIIVQERIWPSFSIKKKKVKECYKIGRGGGRGDGPYIGWGMQNVMPLSKFELGREAVLK